VIVGEAGVGKSRLVTAVGTDARERGARVLLGRCYETQQILPFGPWVETDVNPPVRHIFRHLETLVAERWVMEATHGCAYLIVDIDIRDPCPLR